MAKQTPAEGPTHRGGLASGCPGAPADRRSLGLVICGGEVPDPWILRHLSSLAGMVVAADSGLDAAWAAGIQPDLWVGDGDSLTRAVPPEIPRIQASRDKDRSDTQLGFDALRQAGCQRLMLAGGGGGRLDHLLAIRDLFLMEAGFCRWYIPGSMAVVVDQDLNFTVQPGQGVSFFALGGGCRLDSKALRWSLGGMELSGTLHSLSNRFTESAVRLELVQGSCLMVLHESEPEGISWRKQAEVLELGLF